VVRRIAGQPLKQFVAAEIAGPLGADFQIGAAEQDWPRIADVVPPPPLPFDLAALDPASPAYKTITGPVADASRRMTILYIMNKMGSGVVGSARSSAYSRAIYRAIRG
jgi:CubicO group peptidase (beta-lactamase class C family)